MIAAIKDWLMVAAVMLLAFLGVVIGGSIVSACIAAAFWLLGSMVGGFWFALKWILIKSLVLW